ncbi:MAG TPA: hypothetical protein DIU15_13600 [Deltaproteobacteria bacterium]|nr:hypothetical protein [Deltaproteobacteria bacterium]HCP47075.1 hypothetical protein [Deltaproteobacteria bacterium]
MTTESDPPSQPEDPTEQDASADPEEESGPGSPLRLNDPAYRALREGNSDLFQELTQDLETVDYSFANLGGVDFRKIDIGRVILRGARLKGADLRGLDLSGHDLDGVSLNGARISGVLFPRELSAAEILMSVERGTRIRHGSGD